MLYEVCVETIDGKVQSVALESTSRTAARKAARTLRFVSRRLADPVVYVRRITEDEYFSFGDDLYFDRLYYGESA